VIISRYRGRWRSVIRRSVQHPALEQEFDFEIVSQNGASDQAVTVVVWNSTQQTVTLVREYMPAPHAFRYGPAAGLVEHTKRSMGLMNAAAGCRREANTILCRYYLMIMGRLRTPAAGGGTILVFCVSSFDTIADGFCVKQEKFAVIAVVCLQFFLERNAAFDVRR
jgi:hypothetical protein